MIYKKLLEFHKKNITITKDGVNPHFHNEYSTLNEVLGKVEPVLSELNVVIIQSPNVDGLRTVLHDTEDDTSIESTVPYIGATDMQKLGGAITYAKRYALIAMLGLADADDDGETASATPKITDALRKKIEETTNLDDLKKLYKENEGLGKEFASLVTAQKDFITKADDIV